jgi:GT2 family glycosyltransferase
LISIVILTHNSEKFIGPCLESIFNQKQAEAFEIIIVDNGSQDNTLTKVDKYKKHIKLISNNDNLGPCRGRNQAISESQGDWILTLDCDVVLDQDFISKAQKLVTDIDRSIGMVQPKILTPDRERIYSCGIYLSWMRRFFDIGKGQKDNKKFFKPCIVFGACAAAALYNRSMLEQIKKDKQYFDEDFFIFVEDVDIAWRAKRNGWKCLFSPAIVCTHVGNSAESAKDLRQYYCMRNRYYMIKKNEGLFLYLIKIIPLFLYDLPRAIHVHFTNKYIKN